MLTLYPQFIPPPFSLPFDNFKFVFDICESISVLLPTFICVIS